MSSPAAAAGHGRWIWRSSVPGRPEATLSSVEAALVPLLAAGAVVRGLSGNWPHTIQLLLLSVLVGILAWRLQRDARTWDEWDGHGLDTLLKGAGDRTAAPELVVGTLGALSPAAARLFQDMLPPSADRCGLRDAWSAAHPDRENPFLLDEDAGGTE